VPFAILDPVRVMPPSATRIAEQAQLLGGLAPPPRQDPAARIAAANHATVRVAHAELERTFTSIAADRARSYAAVGITSSR